MPLYEYECEKCGRFERIQKFSDRPVRKCPTCKGPIERLVSAPAIQFKGSGWYVNDYGKGNGSRPAESDKPTPATKDSDDAKKSAPKTEKKADKKADAA